MTTNIVYPKPLPVVIKQNLIRDSGFTSTEIVALQNCWRLIKRRLNYHSAKIFTNEHHLMLERFRDDTTEKIDLSNLHRHRSKLMSIYGHLIESGIDDVTYFNILLNEVGQRHRSNGVTYDDIKMLTDYITQYFVEFLEKIKSPTILSGLKKLSELINEHHREQILVEEDKLSKSKSEISS